MKFFALALVQDFKNMKNILILSLAILICMPFAAHAQDSLIAVVDIDKILSDSKAGQSIQTQLKKKREAFQKEFSARENNLVNAEKTLVQQQGTVPAEEFDTKRKKFEQELLQTRNLFQKRRNSLDKALSVSLSQLRSNIIRVTSEIAEEKSYSVVLTRDSVVIIDKKMDITEMVLNKMNTRVQSIPLVVSE